MMNTKRNLFPEKTLKIITLASGLILLNACGGAGSKTPNTTVASTNTTKNAAVLTSQEEAIKTIMEYAASNGNSVAPTIKDYTNAGVKGVNNNSDLAEMNQVIENLTTDEIDSKEELQVLSDALGSNSPAPIVDPSQFLGTDISQLGGIEEIQVVIPLPAQDTIAPVFTSPTKATAEKGASSVITLVATDKSAVTYSISGENADQFTVDTQSGVVYFKIDNNFIQNLANAANRQGTYIFTGKATDASGNFTEQDIEITIKKDNPLPII